MTSRFYSIFTACTFSTVFSLALIAHGEEVHHEAAGKGHAEEAVNLDFVKQPEMDVTKATRPAKPALLEPEPLQKVTGTNVTLKWKAVEGADGYHVQVATDPNFKWLVVDEQGFPQTSIQPQGLNAGQNYYWRVAAVRSSNDPTWTKSFFSSSSFQTH